MRNETSKALINLFYDSPYVFLTGDLGFMALEQLQTVLGKHFINAGVAEQNMVSVAAGIASIGLQAWVYSIAPFVYARPFEQIRNDVCLHNFDVKLIGNGGGYGYGSMGSSHHAIEDYGVLLTLQNMRAYIPAFSEDVEVAVRRMSTRIGPAYLRLGLSEKPVDFPLNPYAPWRRLLAGEQGSIVAVGPIAGGFISRLSALDISSRPSLWVVSELPISADSLPEDFIHELRQDMPLIVVEEHVSQGGAGHMLAAAILSLGVSVQEFRHHFALGYPSGLYGSQRFHRKECGLDYESVLGYLGI
ncbi:MAG: transketolase [Candidatus Methylumidiphilus sp.]